jgi:hypothetical protein
VLRIRDRTQFYLLAVAVLMWVLVGLLPARLSRAARELSAGQTTSMEAVLLIVCLVWLVVLLEPPTFSMSSRQLLRFPLNVRSLIAVRVLSLFCSPVALLALAGSVASLAPFLSAPNPALGIVAAVLLFGVVLGSAMSVSHLLSVGEWRYTLLLPLAVVGLAVGAILAADRQHGIDALRAATAFVPHLVTAAAVGGTPRAALLPVVGLLAVGAPVGCLFVWAFRRSLFSEQRPRAAGRGTEPVFRLPGRFGGLVRKEQRYFRKLLDPWMALMIVIVVSAVSFFLTASPLVRQLAMLVVIGFNFNLIMNGFGLDSGIAVHRYFIFPIRGRDILLVKNLGLLVIVAAQLSLLTLVAAVKSGIVEAGVEILEAAVLLGSHLAWGNIMTVSRPFRMQFYRPASSGDPLTVQAGLLIGSLPAVAMIRLLRSDSALAPAGIALIVLMVAGAYRASLHYAGRLLELQRHIISFRLS